MQNKNQGYTCELSREMNKFYQNSNIYCNELRSVANKGHYSAYFEYVNKFAKKGSKLFDMGCGIGTVPYLFNQEGFDAYGLDVSFKFISNSCSLQNSRLHYVTGSVFELPFKDKSFDVVGNYDVIEHIPDMERFLTEGLRVLKPGGIFVIICPSILTPFTPIKALFNPEKSHSIYTRKWFAFKRIFINLFLIIKKKISKRTVFYYMQPLLDENSWRREVDAVYQASPIDLKNFLKNNNMDILHYQNDGPNFLHKLVGRFLPDFASTIYMVARKK